MRGLAVLSIFVMLAGQGIAAWAIWMSPDIIENAHKRRTEEASRPNSYMTWSEADKLREREHKDAGENRSLGLKLYGGGFLVAIAFSVLANFTTAPTRERRTKPGTKVASVAVVLAIMPFVIAVVAFAVSLKADRSAANPGSGGSHESTPESRGAKHGAVLEDFETKLNALASSDHPDSVAIHQEWLAMDKELAANPAHLDPGQEAKLRRLRSSMASAEFKAWLKASDEWRRCSSAVSQLDDRKNVISASITYGDLILGTSDEYRAVIHWSKSCVLRIEREELKRLSGSATGRSLAINVIDRGEKLYEYYNAVGAVTRTEYRTVYEYTSLEPLKDGEHKSAVKDLESALVKLRQTRDQFFAAHK